MSAADGTFKRRGDCRVAHVGLYTLYTRFRGVHLLLGGGVGSLCIVHLLFGNRVALGQLAVAVHVTLGFQQVGFLNRQVGLCLLVVGLVGLLIDGVQLLAFLYFLTFGEVNGGDISVYLCPQLHFVQGAHGGRVFLIINSIGSFHLVQYDTRRRRTLHRTRLIFFTACHCQQQQAEY
jgi:hypothetical protein